MTSIWQTSEWNKMIQNNKQSDKIIELNSLFIQKRKVGLGQYGLFGMGIHSNQEIDFHALENLCKKEQALFIQLETVDYDGSFELSKISGSFKEGYHKKFITPFTALIDLTQTHDEILAQMKPKGRYNIKLADKKEVSVELVEKNQKNIHAFFTLSKETTSRDKFSGHTQEYYIDFLNTLPESQLILAKKDDQVIAGGIFIFGQSELSCKEKRKFPGVKDVSIYYYGASTSDKQYRNLMAPYLVQWTAIKHAKESGSKIYDFLGVSGEGEFGDPSLKGVTDFKMKLTKNSKKVSNSYIFINKKIKYSFIMFSKKLKKLYK